MPPLAMSLCEAGDGGPALKPGAKSNPADWPRTGGSLLLAAADEDHDAGEDEGQGADHGPVEGPPFHVLAEPGDAEEQEEQAEPVEGRPVHGPAGRAADIRVVHGRKTRGQADKGAYFAPRGPGS